MYIQFLIVKNYSWSYKREFGKMQDAYCNTTLQKYRHNSEGWGVFFLANVNKKRVLIALLGYIDY